MNNISPDYFCHRIESSYQNQANLLLATTGVLNALSGDFKLFITSIIMENKDKLSFENIQRFTMLVTVLNKDGIKVNTISLELPFLLKYEIKSLIPLLFNCG